MGKDEGERVDERYVEMDELQMAGWMNDWFIYIGIYVCVYF